MKTEELVTMLATGAQAVDPRAPARRAGLALVLGAAAALVICLGVLGVQPQLAGETRIAGFWLRELFCLCLALGAFVAVWRLARPGRLLGAAPALVAAPVLLMWAVAAVTLASAPPPARVGLLMGQTAAACPFLIALLSLPFLAAVLWILRELAPTRLAISGLAAGIAAGSSGALVYTLHCPELAPAFIAVWYVLGMLIPALAGALLGPRLLRW